MPCQANRFRPASPLSAHLPGPVSACLWLTPRKASGRAQNCGGLAAGPHHIPGPPPLPKPWPGHETTVLTLVQPEEGGHSRMHFRRLTRHHGIHKKYACRRECAARGSPRGPAARRTAASRKLAQKGTRAADKGAASQKTQGCLKNARLAPKKGREAECRRAQKGGASAARAFGGCPSRRGSQGRHPTFRTL